MPSKMRSLFKSRKSNDTNNDSATPTKTATPSTPPMSPIDPDTSTASYDGENDARSSARQLQFTQQQPQEQTLEISKSSRFPSLSKRFGKTSNVKSNNGVPIITSFEGADHFSPSLVQSKNAMEDGYFKKAGPRPRERPDARSSAFGGPVRYDWMDIETVAAIKVQAAYRRARVLTQLEEQGLSTAGIRNRRRKRNAKNRMIKSEDVPFPFSLCGIGFLFGDGTMEDERVTAELEKKKVNKKKKEVELEDVQKRKFRMRKKESKHLEEGVEVVENFEEEEEEEEDVFDGLEDEEEVKGKDIPNGNVTSSTSSRLSSARRMIPF